MILVGGCVSHGRGLFPMPRAQDSMIILPSKPAANPLLLLWRAPISLPRAFARTPEAVALIGVLREAVSSVVHRMPHFWI